MTNTELEKVRQQALEEWNNATLANGFIFNRIMVTNPDICKHLLEILLHRKIDRIDCSEAEKSIDVDLDSKGIRMDVYVKNEQEVFDLEIQIIDTKELPKRARYYQGLIDVDNLTCGMDYNSLKDSYVIFLCMTDIFGKGLPVYRFQNICQQDHTILLNDRSYKIFFNSSLYDKMESAEEKDFFTLLKTGKPESEFTARIMDLVTSAKHNTQWRHKFMNWQINMNAAKRIAREEGLAEGLEKGREQQKAEDEKLLSEANAEIERLREKNAEIEKLLAELKK